MKNSTAAYITKLVLVLVLNTTLALAQEKSKKQEEFSIGDINAHVLKIQYDGEQLYCPKKVLDLKKGERLKIKQDTVTKTLIHLNLVRHEINRVSVSQYMTQSRKVRFLDAKVTDGRYKSVKTVLGPRIEFYSLDGSKVERNEVEKRIGTKAGGILILQKEQKIPESWTKIIRDDVLQVRSRDLIGKICRGMADQQTLAESLAQLSGHVIKVRFDGNNLVYPKKTLKLRKGETPRTVAGVAPIYLSTIVTFQENINGRTYQFQRRVQRCVNVPAFRAIEAQYETTEIAVNKKTRFFTSDGIEITHDQVFKSIGMKKSPILVLPQDAKIQKLWKLVLRDDALIVCSNVMLEAAFNNSLATLR